MQALEPGEGLQNGREEQGAEGPPGRQAAGRGAPVYVALGDGAPEVEHPQRAEGDARVGLQAGPRGAGHGGCPAARGGRPRHAPQRSHRVGAVCGGPRHNETVADDAPEGHGDAQRREARQEGHGRERLGDAVALHARVRCHGEVQMLEHFQVREEVGVSRRDLQDGAWGTEGSESRPGDAPWHALFYAQSWPRAVASRLRTGPLETPGERGAPPCRRARDA